MNTPKPFSDKALQSLLSELAGKEDFVFLESTRVTAENHRSYLFLDPIEKLTCRQDDDPAAFLDRVQERQQQGLYLAGYLSYELGYLLEPCLAGSFRPRLRSGAGPALPLAELGVFRTAQVYDHLAEAAFGNHAWPAGAKQSVTAAGFNIDNLRLNLEEPEYLEAIARIKSYIGTGDTYQVNFTLKMLFDFTGSPREFYGSLRRNQSVAYGGFIKSGGTTILSFSPELFFRKQGGIITVRPMKGTMRRGRTVAEDREFAGFLHNDVKNRSENVMIVDLLRNDLGRLSRMGGVNVQSLFDVETYETLLQMTSTIKGKLHQPMSLADMFRALFPCGSVTGAPKIRTMEIIRELEVEDRSVYTGAIGYISPDGDAVFNVPIRTVVLQGSRGEMGIGSGIVWDSDPVGEWEECKLKGRFLMNPAPEFKLIETLLWHPEPGYWLLDLHLGRLAESAGYFLFPCDTGAVRKSLAGLAESFRAAGPAENRRVRLTLARDGEIDLSAVELGEGPLPAIDPPALQPAKPADLPKVMFSDIRTDSNSPYLFHKTTIRKPYDEERTRAAAGGIYEVLFLNEREEVTEGSFTNIFVLRGGRLITPPVSCGLLPGILRQHLFLEYPDLVREEILSPRDVEQAEAVFVGNSVRGLVQVQLR